MMDKLIILRALKRKLEEVYSGSLNNVVLFGSQASNKASVYSE